MQQQLKTLSKYCLQKNKRRGDSNRHAFFIIEQPLRGYGIRAEESHLSAYFPHKRSQEEAHPGLHANGNLNIAPT